MLKSILRDSELVPISRNGIAQDWNSWPFEASRFDSWCGRMEIGKKIKFEISNEDQLKRRIVIFPLILFFLSFFALLLIHPDNGVYISLTTAFLVGIIFKICDWIEVSKMTHISKNHFLIANNLGKILLIMAILFFLTSILCAIILIIFLL